MSDVTYTTCTTCGCRLLEALKYCVVCGSLLTTLAHGEPHVPVSPEAPPLPEYNGKIQVVVTSSAAYDIGDWPLDNDFIRKK